MPYCKAYGDPKKDDALWGNDSLLPADKRFDTANPPDDLKCTLGDNDHQDPASGYIFDPTIGWNLACYEHISEVCDSDRNYFKNHFRPGPPDMGPGGAPADVSLIRRGVRTVPEGAMCDRGENHANAADSPPALVGIFPSKSAPEFLCGPCALFHINDVLFTKAGQFDPFEMIPATQKET